MTARNDITKDKIKTHTANEKYRAGWDLIWLKKKPKQKKGLEEKLRK